MAHDEIANLVGKTEPACRQLLKRAREHVATERRTLQASDEVHRRLLRAFLKAAVSGDVGQVASLLAADVVLIADAGPDGGSYGRVRNVPRPVVGAAKVAAFVATITPQGSAGLTTRECQLNGGPAILVLRDGRPYTAVLLAVANDEICGAFMQADPARLRRVGEALQAGS